MRHRFAVLPVLLVLPLIVGCAQIKSFSVTPSTVCPGETVKIDWKASGDVMLEALPPLRGAGEGPAEGFRSFTPLQNTRFILKVPGLLKSVQREWDVQVVPSQSSRLLGGTAICMSNSPVVSTSFTIQPRDTSALVHAASIVNSYQRPISVVKDGVEVDIPPNSATDRFKTVPIIGEWTIRTPILGHEACDNTLEAVKGRLIIKTEMICKGSNGES